MKLALRNLIALTTLVSSCASLGSSPVSMDELRQGLDRESLTFTDRTVEEIAGLQAELPRPFRLAIAPPREVVSSQFNFYTGQGGTGSGSADVWTSKEREVIQAWNERFRERGWLVDLVILPYSLVVPGVADADLREGSTYLERVRVAAARERADAVLVIQSNSAAYSEFTPWAVLDLTLVGAMIFDAHRVHAATVMEGLLFDTRNEYLYLSASGEASMKDRTPAFMISQTERRLLERSRLAALRSLAERLNERVIALDS